MKKQVEILEAALEKYEYSLYLFKQCQEAEENNDSEMENIYWAATQEASGITRGLLMAYEITTGKKLNEWDIKRELKSIA